MPSDLFQGYCDISRRTANPHWFLFEDEGEKSQHESALARLIESFPDQRDQVHRLYVETLREFAADATIRSFLSIFVIREVKGALCGGPERTN